MQGLKNKRGVKNGRKEDELQMKKEMDDSFDVKKSYEELRSRMLKEGLLVPSKGRTTEEYAKLFAPKCVTFRKKLFYPIAVLSALILISVSSLTTLMIVNDQRDTQKYIHLIDDAIKEAGKYLDDNYENYVNLPTHIYQVHKNSIFCFYDASREDHSYLVGQLYSDNFNNTSLKVVLSVAETQSTLFLEQGNKKNDIKEILERTVYVHTPNVTLYDVSVSCYVDDVLTSCFSIEL